MIETGNGEVHVAICSSGSQFFWCVVDMKTLEVLAHGRKTKLEDAEEQIWAQAAIHRKDRRVIQVDEAFARRVRKAMWQEQHYKPLGIYAYEHWYDESEGQWESIELDIVRKTDRHIVVKELFCNVYFRLDRHQFESKGEVYCRRNRRRFFDRRYEDKFPAGTPNRGRTEEKKAQAALTKKL